MDKRIFMMDIDFFYDKRIFMVKRIFVMDIDFFSGLTDFFLDIDLYDLRIIMVMDYGKVMYM